MDVYSFNLPLLLKHLYLGTMQGLFSISLFDEIWKYAETCRVTKPYLDWIV